MEFVQIAGRVSYSPVGMQERAQQIQLGVGDLLNPVATPVSTIVHEIGHAVGLWHEQSRQDRKNFVTIYLDRVQEHADAFNQHIEDGDDLGPYDYDSIMHYDSCAFSRDGCRLTGNDPNKLRSIVRIDGSVIGPNLALSAGDIAAANALYPRWYNKFLLHGAGNTWRSVVGLNPLGVNGFRHGKVVTGKFGFDPAGPTRDCMFLLAPDGSNRFLYRDNNRRWIGTDQIFPSPEVSGYNLVISGQFGRAEGGPFDDIFFVRPSGENRMLYRDKLGKWQSVENFFSDTSKLAGFTHIVRGDFGGRARDHDILLLNLNLNDGKNRLISRDQSGDWQISDNPIPTGLVDNYHFIVSGGFGGHTGDDIFLLSRNGRNRFVNRTADTWVSSDSFEAGALADYDLIATGRFDETSPTADILLVTRSGANRLLFRNAQGNWQQRSLPLTLNDLRDYYLVATGGFGGDTGDDLYFLDGE